MKTAEDLRIKGLAEVSWREEMEDGGGDGIITRSRKHDEPNQQFSSPTNPEHLHTSPIQRHVSANVIAGPNISSNFRQSPLHLLQSRLNAPPPEFINRLSHPYPHHTGRPNPMQQNLPMVRLPPPNPNYQQPSQIITHQPPQTFHNRNHLQQQETQPPLPVKRKRGRPPLDGEFDSYSTPKITHVEGAAATSIVEAVLDDGSQSASNPQQPNDSTKDKTVAEQNQLENNDLDPNVSPGHVRLVDLPALLSNAGSPRVLRPLQRRQTINDSPESSTRAPAPDEEWTEFGMQMDCEEDNGGLVPKLERPDSPGDEEAIKQMYQKSEPKQPRSISPPATPANSSVSELFQNYISNVY